MSTALLLAEPHAETRPDLVLLGDTTALGACRARHGDVPVIILGEPESDTVDRVRALDGGCDDFLAKPFDYEELLARIRAVLRRTTPAAHDTLRAGPIA